MGRRFFAMTALAVVLGIAGVAAALSGSLEGLSPAGQAESDAKKAAVQNQEDLLARGDDNFDARAVDDDLAPPPYSPPAWTVGIFEGEDAFPPHSGWETVNIVRMEYQDKWVVVVAALPSESEHAGDAKVGEGVAFIMWVDPNNLGESLEGPIQVPLDGPVRIVEVGKGTVTFGRVGTDGTDAAPAILHLETESFS